MAAGSSRSHAYKENRQAAIERDEYQCMLALQGCTGEATQADHITPVSKARELGWTDEQIDALDNLQGSCAHCNNKKNNKEETRQTWYNPKWFNKL